MKEQKLGKGDIIVNEDGMFTYGISEGNVLKADTLEKLREKIARASKAPRVKIAVECTYVNYHEPPKPATITGLHAENGNLLVKIEGEKGVTQLSSYNSDKLYRRFTETEVQEFAHLKKAAAQAEKAVEQYLKERQVDGFKLARAALGS